MRPGEVDGTRLLLRRPDRSSRRWSKQGELLEWATVFDNRYGTPRAPVEAALSAGPRRAVRHRLAGHAAVAPEGRRRRRPRVHPAAVGRRSREAAAHARAGFRRGDPRPHGPRRHEISHWAEYDYVVVNHNVDDAFAEVQSILKAERLKRERAYRPDRVRSQAAAPAGKIAAASASVSSARCGRAGTAFPSPAAPDPGRTILGHLPPFLGRACRSVAGASSVPGHARSLLRHACTLLRRARPILRHARIVHGSGAPQPASSSWNIGCGERRFVFGGIPHRAALAAHGARARMRPIRTIALTVRPASARARPSP